MTVSSTPRKAGPFVGNGAQTSFPFTFKVFAPTDLEVVRVVVATGVETVLTYQSQYSVTLNADQDANPGGTVTLSSALAIGQNLIVTSDLPITQPTDITNLGGFYPNVLDDALDRGVIQAQQLSETLGRALKFPITDNVSSELPAAGVRKGTLLAFDAVTGAPVVGPTAAGIQAQTLSWQGVRTSNPSTRIDGSALQNGDQYWNSANTQQRIYFSGTWYAVSGSVAEAASVVYQPANGDPTNVQAKLREVVSVKDFGAVGDGVADDMNAIKDALDEGVPVYLPKGTYRITEPLYLDSGSVIFGDGPQTVILKDSTTAGTGSNTARAGTVTDSYVKNAAIIVRHANNAASEQVVIRDLTLESASDGAGGYKGEFGIFAPRLRQAALANLRIKAFRYGFVTHQAERCALSNVDIDCATQRGVNGSDYGWASGSVAFRLQDDGSASAAGSGVSLSGCAARNAHTAFEFYKAEGVSVAGCRAENLSQFVVAATGGGGTIDGLGVQSVLCAPSAFSFVGGAVYTLAGCVVNDPQGLAEGTSRALHVDASSVTLANTSFANFSTVGAAQNINVATGGSVMSLVSTLPTNGVSSGFAGTGALHQFDSSSWRSTTTSGVRYAVMSSASAAKAVLASGQTSVVGNTLIETGVSGLDTKVVLVQARTIDDAVPLRAAHVVGVSGTSFRVKFTNLADGTATTAETKIDWAVIG